ncbi:MAG: ribosome maturation factor RimM [bacterium]
MSSPRKFVRLGKILQEWGIHGQVRFISFNPQSELYPDLDVLYAEDRGEAPYAIESIKRHGRYWLLKLKGYEDPEHARELRGIVLGLPREALPEPESGEIYLSDLEGLEVRAADGRRIGVVAGFLSVGDHEVMQIRDESGRETLVPYQKDFVASTDREEGVIVLKEFADELLG